MTEDSEMSEMRTVAASICNHHAEMCGAWSVLADSVPEAIRANVEWYLRMGSFLTEELARSVGIGREDAETYYSFGVTLMSTAMGRDGLL